MGGAFEEGNTEGESENIWLPKLLSISLKFSTISLGQKMWCYDGRVGKRMDKP